MGLTGDQNVCDDCGGALKGDDAGAWFGNGQLCPTCGLYRAKPRAI